MLFSKGYAIPEGLTAYVLTKENDDVLLWNASSGEHFNYRDIHCPLMHVYSLINAENVREYESRKILGSCKCLIAYMLVLIRRSTPTSKRRTVRTASSSTSTTPSTGNPSSTAASPIRACLPCRCLTHDVIGDNHARTCVYVCSRKRCCTTPLRKSSSLTRASDWSGKSKTRS